MELTGSPRGKEILDNFGEYLPKFKKVLPHDYDKMLRLIAQMEEKGEDSEQAQIEAFYAMKNASKGGSRIMGKPTGFMEYSNGRPAPKLPPEERITEFQRVSRRRCIGDEQQTPGCPLHGLRRPLLPERHDDLGGMVSGCPLNNLIPEWNDLIYQGNWELALRRLTATNRFPEFTSRVCPALCEAACTCGMTTGDPVTVKENEHAIIEYGYSAGLSGALPALRVRTGKKVAVVGAGPAGLAAADLLNQRGHSVTVFEREDRVGGLLMYGIPNMKLEKWVIDRRVERHGPGGCHSS